MKIAYIILISLAGMVSGYAWRGVADATKAPKYIILPDPEELYHIKQGDTLYNSIDGNVMYLYFHPFEKKENMLIVLDH